MSILFLSQSQRQAAALLRKAGLSQLPIAATIQLTRETAENWLHQEMEQGNLPLIFQMVKGDCLEKDSQLLFDELKDLVVAKYIMRLQLDYDLASQTATVLLPFILKRMVELMQKNPQFKMWWENMDLRKHLPSREFLKTRFRNMGSSWHGKSSENNAFA
jgi:transposase